MAISAPPDSPVSENPTKPSARPYGTDGSRRGRIIPTGWPPPGLALRVLFIGYPIWWIVGVTEFACLGAAAVMAYELVRERRVELPRGFLLWALFLVWVVMGLLLLQVNAPGAVPGPQNTRYVTWFFRLAWYLSATVVMAYVITMRRKLPTTALLRAISWLFVTLTVGGLLGALRPELQVQSVLEILLPGSIDSIPFVRDLIHPTVAQLYTDDGSLNPRPSAPFPYTNDWGVTYACLVPLFLISWFGKDAGWRRYAGPIVLLASLVPVIESLNRGLWLALVGMGLFVMVRSALLGQVKYLAAGLVALVVLTALVALSPLRGVIDERLSGEAPSNDSRANLGIQSVETVSERSPIAGLGTTRDVQGSFTSIAVGSTAACPLCSPPALGTQGQLWLVMFSQGLVGLTFYLGFLIYQLVSHQWLRTGVVTAASCVLIGHFITMPFYGAIGPALLIIAAAIGLLARETDEQRDAAAGPRTTWVPRTRLSQYTTVVRSNAWLLAGGVFLGLVGGAWWQHTRPATVVAETRILFPVEASYDVAGTRPATLDTIAQLAGSRGVVDEIRGASDQEGVLTEEVLTVSALPNTRVLILRVVAPSADRAEAGAAAGAEALLQMRDDTLQLRQARVVDTLTTRSEGAAAAVSTIDQAIVTLVEGGTPRESLSLLSGRRFELAASRDESNIELAEAQGASLNVGRVIRPGEARTLTDSWNLALTTGALLGLIGAITVIGIRGEVGRRARSTSAVAKLLSRAPPRAPTQA